MAQRLAVIIIAVAPCACSTAPMNYMHTFGRAANPITSLGWGLTVISSFVVIIIGALLLIGTSRARLPSRAFCENTIARTGNGLPWIYIGVGISTLVLLGIIVWTMFVLKAIASPAEQPAFTIEIRAHQWWWELRYLGESPERTFTTANELHIPVGRSISLRLIGDDVIHSFWIPALAGKTDVIPGQTNVAWIEADQVGRYRGQCTEYCGEQHAHMAAFVEAQSEPEFRQWWDAQLAAAAAPTLAPIAKGEVIFQSRCGACHSVRGTAAGGILGPDLTHVMSRRTIAAGTLPTTASALTQWIANAQDFKPGCRMPPVDLTQADLAAVTAYVRTLR